MKRELEIKDIRSYVGHDIECSYLDISEDGKRTKAILTGVSKSDGVETTYKRKRKGCHGDYISFNGRNNLKDLEFKLHLHPWSHIAKEIEVDGKKFIPLLILRDIEQGNWDDGQFMTDHTQIIDYGVRDGDSPCYWVEWKDGLRQTQSFSFKGGDFSRFWIRDRNRFGGIDNVGLNNQNMLFQKLEEWGFDINNLIAHGLAVAIKDIS